MKSNPVYIARKTFITEDGREIPIKAISLLELNMAEEGIKAEYIERGEPITPPTYSVETVGGDKETHPLTADNLVTDDPTETERRTRLWAEHQDALNRMESEIGRIKTSIVMEGIDIAPENDDWLARKKRLHIKVPDDPDERLLFYKMTEAVKTPADLSSIQLEIIVLSSSGAIDRKAADAAKESFRSKLQGIASGLAGQMAETRNDSGETTPEPLGS